MANSIGMEPEPSSEVAKPRLRRWTCLACLICLVGCATTRPPSPPRGEIYALPWGAVAIDNPAQPIEESLRRLMVAGIRHRLQHQREKYSAGQIPYRLLALSGGGSLGAYGAGVLVGWTESGDRPEFDVVTGISTGALMATFAFLGPDYDDELHIYTRINDDSIHSKVNPVSALAGNSFTKTKRLRSLLASFIDEEILDAVAREYAQGRRLFIGTTNLDARAFTVWDMGAIAASDRPDRMERYLDVVMASASIPALFPPVYIPVEAGDQTYWQMHVDGGVRRMVFAYEFKQDLVKVAEDLGLERADLDGEVYLLHNGTVFATSTYTPVKPNPVGIARSSLMALVKTSTNASLYRVYVKALVNGLDFHIAYIPQEYDLDFELYEFEQERMQRLFEFGRAEAAAGRAWKTTSAPNNADDMMDLIDPISLLETVEGRPDERR